MGDSIRVLHVDDEADYSELVKSFLESRNVQFEVQTTTSANTALNRLNKWGIDCIVSDYQMPEMDGLEFLEAIRAEKPNIPFLLLTGRGSEEIASDAITAGVTDYIPKGGRGDTYTLLANRIKNAVESYRNEQELRETRTRLRLLVEESTDAIYIVSRDGRVKWANPVTHRLLGRSPEETIGTSSFENVHPDDLETVKSTFEELTEIPRSKVSVRFRVRTAEGDYIAVEARGRNLLDHPVIRGNVVYLRKCPRSTA